MVDSGAHQTIMSTSMARALGLPITPDTNCGQYSVAGGTLLSYAGYVSGVVDLQFGEGVAFRISGLRLVANEHPLFLLGKDVLQGGRDLQQWNYAGEDIWTWPSGETGGCLKFLGDGKIVKRPYYWVPSAKAAPFTNRPGPSGPGRCV